MHESGFSDGSLRSREWFDTAELYGWTRRAALQGMGFNPTSYEGRPLVGIANSWSELTHCNVHLRSLAEAVKRGVWQAGGCPFEFPVMSLGEFNMRPTTMLFRNLMSMEVEESIRANPLDGVVLLGGCDKTTPALLMGAASADLPSILVTGGPQLTAHWRGESLGSCTDCRRYHAELRAGRLSEDEWTELQSEMVRSPGHCMTMGTASTMGTIAEAMGIALPGNGTIPAADAARLRLAEEAGRRIVPLIRAGVRPSDLLTRESFENGIRTLHALAGSTNVIVHLAAWAGRLNIELPLSLFDELSRSTPVLLNLKPSGQFLMEDFHYAGGATALLGELASAGCLHLDLPTVTGETLGEQLRSARNVQPNVIRPASNPLQPDGGLVVLHGTLAPRGAILKKSAASGELLRHRGRAVVFENHDDLLARIDDPHLNVHPEDVLVLRNCGPVGAPGMPEWGLLPIPKKLLDQGIRDMVRLSDARISGTARGTVIVHVAPESAVGGPLAAVRNGDWIELNTDERRLDLLIEQDVLDRRLQELSVDRSADRSAAIDSSQNNPTGTALNGRTADSHRGRGYLWLYRQHVLQADEGCDFDFLRP